MNTGELSLCPAIRTGVAGVMEGYPVCIRTCGCLADDYDGIKYYSITDTWSCFVPSVTKGVKHQNFAALCIILVQPTKDELHYPGISHRR